MHPLFTADLCIPSVNLIIEINGVRAMYPYTRKESQSNRFKSSFLRGSSLLNARKHKKHNLFNLNVHTLAGMSSDNEKLVAFI